MSFIDDIHRTAAEVKGFLAPEEGARLHALALEVVRQSAPCLEIGSYCGKSALYLGYACREKGAALFSIDHHRGSEEQQPGEGYFDPALFSAEAHRVDTFLHFRRTVEAAGLEDVVVPVVAASDVVARSWATPLGMVFIDGGHAYDTVRSDYLCWASHVVSGGYLLFHDIYPDPADGGQAPYEIYQTALASGSFAMLPMTGSLGVLRKK